MIFHNFAFLLMKKRPLPMTHPSYVWSCMAYRSYAPYLCLPSIWLQSFASISGLLYNSLISFLSQFYFTFSIFYGFESFMYLLKFSFLLHKYSLWLNKKLYCNKTFQIMIFHCSYIIIQTLPLFYDTIKLICLPNSKEAHINKSKELFHPSLSPFFSLFN